MVLDFKTYQDKVIGCWVGKNIGGVLGAPFEGLRQFNDVDFYAQDLTMGPPPNDDLDLQIAWLAAVERYGRNVNASILGDSWLIALFGEGKGSGAAALFFVLALAGTLLCLTVRMDHKRSEPVCKDTDRDR